MLPGLLCYVTARSFRRLGARAIVWQPTRTVEHPAMYARIISGFVRMANEENYSRTVSLCP
jgi:hypothetical protein